MSSNQHILCQPLLLLLSVFPSIRVFSNESVIHINCQKYWSFSFSISSSSEYSGLLSFPFSSVAQSCLTLCDPVDCSKPGFCVHHQLLEITKHMSIESVVLSNHLILCHPLHLQKRIYIRISSRTDWVYLLAVQGILKSVLQYYISKASILQRSAFFVVQLSD